MAERAKGRRGFALHAGALALYALLAVVYTYPLAFNLDRVNGHGDPGVMVWSMAWISHALASDASLYDANIFHPAQDALTYTDFLLTSALMDAPFYLATGNALLGFNVVLLLTYVLSGYFTYLLVRRLLAGWAYALPAALFAGGVYAVCPYRFGHITQLNSMTTYWLPLILLFMHRYLEGGRRPRDLFLAGLFFTLNALSGLYYGVFAALMVAAFYGIWSILNREPPRLRDFLYGIPAAAVFGAVLVLLLWPYIASAGDGEHGRSIEIASGGSVMPGALLTSPPGSLLLGWTPEAFGTTNADGVPMFELTLYPGLAVAALAAGGLLWRRVPRTPVLYALIGLAIFILSLGPFVQLGETRLYLPYALLYEYAPGFSNLRVPARMWAIVMLCIAVLAAFGLRALMERLTGRRAALALAAIALFTALEFMPALPIDHHVADGPPDLAPAYAYLAENSGKDTVVAEVPFASRQDPFRETPRMYRSTRGWWQLVNGYGSYFPAGHAETRERLNGLPGPEAMEELRRLGVDYVIVHPEEYEQDGENGRAVLRAARREPALERVAGDERAILFRVESASAQS